MQKNNHINKFVIILTLLIISINSYSQNEIWSPYSRYGIGELSFVSSPFYSSMSGTAIGVRTPRIINIKNPASLSAIPAQTFLFDGSLIFNPRIIENYENRVYSMNSGLNSLQFAFAATEKLGVSFGLIPFSSVGYNIKDSSNTPNIGKVNYIYQGSGGISNLYLSTGYELLKGLSVGANINYYFGNIERKRIALFDTVGFVNTRITNRFNISDVHLEFGMQYHNSINRKEIVNGERKTIKTDYSYTLGLTFGNPTNLNTKGRKLAERFPGLNPDAIARDTIVNLTTENSSIKLPMMLGGGFSFQKKERWQIAFDIAWIEWSDFLMMDVSDSLANSLSMSLGGSFVPKEGVRPNVLRRTTYLFGLHYYDNYIDIKNTSLKMYGMSFGISVPIRRSGTTVNFSVELGQNGTKTNNLIRETYGKIKFGVSISENWFMRRKFE